MDSFDVVFTCIGDGTGTQSCYHDGLKVASICPTEENEYLVKFFVMCVEDKFVPDLETAQLVVWGAVAARHSGAMYQAVRIAAYAHVH